VPLGCITTPKLPTLGTASDESESPLAKILPNYKTLSKTTSGDYSCSEGGSLSSSMEGSVSTILYENCQEAGATINGTVTLSYDESSKEITYGMKDYSILTSTGEYSVEDTTYVVSASLIKYTVSGETTHNGTNLNFDDYSYVLSLIENRVNISINGSLMTESLGNWITIKTNAAMQVSDNTCPTSGNIDIQGEDSILNITFLNDKGIEERLDGTVVEVYESCEMLPKLS